MNDEPDKKHPVVGHDGELINPDKSFDDSETLEEVADSSLADEQPLLSISPIDLRSLRELGDLRLPTNTLRKVLFVMVAGALSILMLVLIIKSSNRTDVIGNSSIPTTPTMDTALPLPGHPSDAIRTSNVTPSSIQDIEWSPDSRYLALSSYGATARIWDMTSGAEFAALDASVQELDWSPDSTRLLGRMREHSVVWNAETGERLFTLAASEYGTSRMLEWSLDGSTIVGVSQNNYSLILYSAQTGWVFRSIELEPLPERQSWLGNLAWTQDRLFAMDSYNFYLWDTDTGQHQIIQFIDRAVFTNQHWSSIAVSDDERYLAVAKADGQYPNWTNQIFIWDIASALMTSPTRVLTLPENEGNNPPVREVFWSPDATQLVTIAGRTLSIWDAATGEQLRAISFDDNLVDVDWSPDGQHLAACTAHYVRVYSMTNGE